MNSLGPIKELITIQLTGYMHIVNPVTSLWGTVSKGKSGTFHFFAKNLDNNNMSEKCNHVHFEDPFNKMRPYNDSTYANHILKIRHVILGYQRRNWI